jgi:hypothetical protein
MPVRLRPQTRRWASRVAATCITMMTTRVAQAWEPLYIVQRQAGCNWPSNVYRQPQCLRSAFRKVGGSTVQRQCLDIMKITVSRYVTPCSLVYISVSELPTAILQDRRVVAVLVPKRLRCERGRGAQRCNKTRIVRVT